MRILVVLGALAFASLACGHDAVGYAVVAPVEDSIVKASKVCTDCVKFFGDIRDIMNNASIEKQLDQLIDEMACDQLGPLADICKDLVQTCVSYLLNIVKTVDDPNQVCGTLGFCSEGMDEAVLLKKVADIVKQTLTKKMKGAAECDECKLVIAEAKKLLQEQAIQQDVEDFLENEVCSLLETAADECKQYVESYTPLVFEILVNELDPVADCVYLGMCSNTSMPVSIARVGLASSKTSVLVIQPSKVKLTKTKVEASLECVLCELVLKEVDQILGSNRSQAAVEQALDSVCGLLPTTIKQECVDFVNEYGAAVIDLLVQEINPEVICRQIGLCNNSLTSAWQFPVNNAECDLCEMAMNYVIQMLKSNETEQYVEKFLEDVCDRLSANMSIQCDAFVKEYTDLVMNLIANDADPKQICQAIKMCSPTGVKGNTLHFKPHILGREECTYGPSYWCASRENAKKCGVEAHCEKHVWN